jgi:hypothetical protein
MAYEIIYLFQKLISKFPDKRVSIICISVDKIHQSPAMRTWKLIINVELAKDWKYKHLERLQHRHSSFASGAAIR